jgi:hypothetical protein
VLAEEVEALHLDGGIIPGADRDDCAQGKEEVRNEGCIDAKNVRDEKYAWRTI